MNRGFQVGDYVIGTRKDQTMYNELGVIIGIDDYYANCSYEVMFFKIHQPTNFNDIDYDVKIYCNDKEIRLAINPLKKFLKEKEKNK